MACLASCNRHALSLATAQVDLIRWHDGSRAAAVNGELKAAHARLETHSTTLAIHSILIGPCRVLCASVVHYPLNDGVLVDIDVFNDSNQGTFARSPIAKKTRKSLEFEIT